MISDARYVHTNLIARDWRALVRFYVEVFGCEPVLPQRDQQGAWLDTATGLDGAHPAVAGVGELELIYLRDPEGNVIELQAWQTDNS